MPRQPEEYRDLHAAADKIEPRMERAVLRALEKMRESVQINDLALAIQGRDRKALDRLLPRERVRDALSPVGTISRDAFVRGGKVGARQVEG